MHNRMKNQRFGKQVGGGGGGARRNMSVIAVLALCQLARKEPENSLINGALG